MVNGIQSNFPIFYDATDLGLENQRNVPASEGQGDSHKHEKREIGTQLFISKHARSCSETPAGIVPYGSGALVINEYPEPFSSLISWHSFNEKGEVAVVGSMGTNDPLFRSLGFSFSVDVTALAAAALGNGEIASVFTVTDFGRKYASVGIVIGLDGTIKQGPVQVGSPLSVTVFTTESVHPVVVGRGGGGFWAFWGIREEGQQTHQVGLQMFDGSGQSRGNATFVEQGIPNPPNPEAAVLTNDHIALAWFNATSPLTVIGKLLDPANGNEVKRFTVNDPLRSGNYSGVEPLWLHVAKIESGFIVVWEDYGVDQPQKGIMGQRYGLDATPRGSPLIISSKGGETGQRPHASEYGAHVIVVWSSQGEIKGKLYHGTTGAIVEDEFPISQRNEALGMFTKPVVASLSNQRLSVVWNGVTAVFAKTLDPPFFSQLRKRRILASQILNWDGHAEQVISGFFPNCIAPSSYPKLILREDTFLYGWLNRTRRQVLANKIIDLQGNVLRDSWSGISPDDDSRAYSMAYLGNHRTIVMWKAQRIPTSHYEVFGNIIDSNGDVVGNELKLSTSRNLFGVAFDSLIALPTSTGFWSIWQGTIKNRESQAGIYASVHDVMGNPIRAQFPVGGADLYIMGATVIADKNIVIAWTGDDVNTIPHVYGKIYQPDGSLAKDAFSTPIDHPGNSLMRSIAVSQSGDGYAVVWTERVSPQLFIRGRQFHANGTTYGDEFLIDTFNQSYVITQQHAAPYKGGFFVVWNQGGDIKGRVYSGPKAANGSSIFPVSLTKYGDFSFPYVYAVGQNIHVTWSGPAGVFARTFSPGFLTQKTTKLLGQMTTSTNRNVAKSVSRTDTSQGVKPASTYGWSDMTNTRTDESFLQGSPNLSLHSQAIPEGTLTAIGTNTMTPSANLTTLIMVIIAVSVVACMSLFGTFGFCMQRKKRAKKQDKELGSISSAGSTPIEDPSSQYANINSMIAHMDSARDTSSLASQGSSTGNYAQVQINTPQKDYSDWTTKFPPEQRDSPYSSVATKNPHDRDYDSVGLSTNPKHANDYTYLGDSVGPPNTSQDPYILQ